MGEAATRRASYEDLLDVPEPLVAEIIHGVLHTHPRRERMPALPDAAWLDLAPDWVCEVLSPSSAKTDRTLKIPIYAHFGVAHLWGVDPLLRTLEAYRLAERHWVLDVTLKDDDPVRLDPFAAIEFPLSDLWA